MAPLSIMTVLGTRPEAVKLAPVIRELARRGDAVRARVTLTAQHREMLDPILENFAIRADDDLNLMAPDQQLPALTAAILTGMDPLLRDRAVDMLVVQGDTTTTFAAALMGYYHRIPVAHVEAGLRTGNMDYPFPEEGNRVLTSRLAALHFAPTAAARDNLLAEGVAAERIAVTGNTVIDALLYTVGRGNGHGDDVRESGRTILVTAHRRENHGAGMERICDALLAIVAAHPDVTIDFPVHLNPRVGEVVRRRLSGRERIRLMAPLDYPSFCRAMARCHLVLSDSGGIQEEAPALDKPVLVLRNETERPEALAAGTARLVGTDPERITAEVGRLLGDGEAYRAMATAPNPFGDGRAAERIVDGMIRYLAARR